VEARHHLAREPDLDGFRMHGPASDVGA
jgi:hypothetical protein